MRSFMPALGLSVVAIGCGTFVTATQLNPPPRSLSSRGFESVEVFSSAPPARAHVDVALLEVEQTHDLNQQGTGLMIQRLRERAGAMGCDAVFIGGMRDSGHGHGYANAGSTKLLATCIVYGEGHPPSSRAPFADRRRMCRDRRDFNETRNCVLPAGAR